MTDIVEVLKDTDGPITDEDRLIAALEIEYLRKRLALAGEVITDLLAKK